LFVGTLKVTDILQALGIDIREETNQDNIAYHRVWFTVEHIGAMSPPPPETPTPSTLGAVDLDPWIPKPSTRDIVDHLVQEINAAKQIAEEITCVQSVLDGMMVGEKAGSVVERVQRELEVKTRRVEELEGLLGVEREERRGLEERIRRMEDERALKMVLEEEKVGDVLLEEETTGNNEENMMETTLVKDTETMLPLQGSSITSLNIPDIAEEEKSTTATTTQDLPDQEQHPSIDEPITTTTTPPLSPSTAPSSPTTNPSTSSTRSISPISLPSTESSASHHQPTTTNPDPTPLLEKITTLEHQLTQAQHQIAAYKLQLSSTSPILTALSPVSSTTTTNAATGGPVLGALTSSTEFPFTFSATIGHGVTPRRRPTGSIRTSRKRPSSSSRQAQQDESSPSESDIIVHEGMGTSSVGKGRLEKGYHDGTEFVVEGLYAAVGVVVLGWMGMWFINHLVERGDRVVR
jgi:hypothetical protein